MKNEEPRRMKENRGRRASGAFTLVELLVVIAVIAALAALTFPAVRAAKISALRARAKSEMVQIETAIERYKDKLGYYPPDNRIASNPDPYALNQLYYELLGTTNANGVFRTLDGSAQINAPALPTVFGPNVTGFMNCVRGGGGDDVPSGAAFLSGLKPSQFLALTTPDCTVLGSKLEGPLEYQNAQGVKVNPWRYNSSSPRHNPQSYDLWIDVTVGEKTNRICNWSDKPQVVSAPYQP